VPGTAADFRNLLRNACRASKAKDQTLAEYLEAQLESNSGLTGRPGIASTSYGGQSASYFSPGQGGALTASDISTFIDSVLLWLPCLTAQLEEELEHPPTHDEICAAPIKAVPSGATEVRNDYTAVRGWCGCA
jgi:hypothetical protein